MVSCSLPLDYDIGVTLRSSNRRCALKKLTEVANAKQKRLQVKQEGPLEICHFCTPISSTSRYLGETIKPVILSEGAVVWSVDSWSKGSESRQHSRLSLASLVLTLRARRSLTSNPGVSRTSLVSIVYYINAVFHSDERTKADRIFLFSAPVQNEWHRNHRLLLNIPNCINLMAHLVRKHCSNGLRTTILKLPSEGHIGRPSFWITELNKIYSPKFQDKFTCNYQSLLNNSYTQASGWRASLSHASSKDMRVHICEIVSELEMNKKTQGLYLKKGDVTLNWWALD